MQKTIQSSKALPKHPQGRFPTLLTATAILFTLRYTALTQDIQPTQQTQAAPVISPAAAPLSEARHLLAIGDYTAAEQNLRTLVTHIPTDPDGHYLLGFTLLHQQKPTDALAEYTRAASLRDPKPEELLGVASAYIQLQDYADAERWLLVATKGSPFNTLAWYLLGRTQYNLNHWQDAEKSFLTCLRLNPQHLRAEYNLGLVYEMLQRPDSAIAAYRAAIAWQEAASSETSKPENPHPKDPQPYLDLGMLLRKQGKLTDALPLLVTAAGNNSRNPLAHQELGLAYEQLGRYDQAIAEMKTAVALAPKAEALHFFLGRLYRRAGLRDDATREFTEAASLSASKSPVSVPNVAASE